MSSQWDETKIFICFWAETGGHAELWSADCVYPEDLQQLSSAGPRKCRHCDEGTFLAPWKWTSWWKQGWRQEAPDCIAINPFIHSHISNRNKDVENCSGTLRFFWSRRYVLKCVYRPDFPLLLLLKIESARGKISSPNWNESRTFSFRQFKAFLSFEAPRDPVTRAANQPGSSSAKQMDT